MPKTMLELRKMLRMIWKIRITMKKVERIIRMLKEAHQKMLRMIWKIRITMMLVVLKVRMILRLILPMPSLQ